MTKRNTTYSLLLGLAMLFFGQTEVTAQKLNYELVSMYVYNFTKFIEWPKNTSDFVIGVYGSSPITDMLTKYITSKHVGNRPIVVRVINSPDDANTCNILFLPLSQSGKIKQLNDQLKGKPVLIVSEKYGMSRKGAAITIFLDEDDDEKTKFDINKTSITDNGLIISTYLLKMAAQIY